MEKKNLLLKYCKFQNTKDLEVNLTQFQSTNSDTCGFFKLYFLFHRMHNLDLDFETLLAEIFDVENLEQNEAEVKSFCNSLK